MILERSNRRVKFLRNAVDQTDFEKDIFSMVTKD